MDCQLFERQVQRGIDGLLAPHERQDMLKHASACPECAALLEDMTALDGLLHTQLGAVEPPAGFADAVMAALPAPYAKPVLRLVLPRQRWARFGSVAAAAVLLIAGAAYGLRPAAPGEPATLAPAGVDIAAWTPDSHNDPEPLQNNHPTLAAAPNPNEQPDETGLIGPNELIDPETEITPENEIPDRPLTQNPQVGEEEPLLPRSMTVDLPRPATYSPRSEGVLSLTLLAAYEDCDATLPSLNDEGLVEFYIRYKGLIHLWTQTLSAAEAPVYVGQVKSLPSLFEITGGSDESSVANYSKVSAVSPDGRLSAVNRGGENPGLWLYDNESASVTAPAGEQTEQGVNISNGLGGGKVLSWSPDGNKLLFTDAAGQLFVYYLAEERQFSLYGGAASCASWAGDSATVVFAGKETKEVRSAIYAIQVP